MTLDVAASLVVHVMVALVVVGEPEEIAEMIGGVSEEPPQPPRVLLLLPPPPKIIWPGV
jgi:hypothetical protein